MLKNASYDVENNTNKSIDSVLHFAVIKEFTKLRAILTVSSSSRFPLKSYRRTYLYQLQ